jgi:hypothetical protein
MMGADFGFRSVRCTVAPSHSRARDQLKRHLRQFAYMRLRVLWEEEKSGILATTR